MPQLVKYEPAPAETYLPFVRKIAGRVARRLPSTVDVDDLVAAGTIGLMEALDRYDPGGGRSFETYAEFRVKGAIFDELRRNDPLNRAARAAQGKISAKSAKLTAELGRPPTAEELSAALDGVESERVDIAGSLRVVSMDMRAMERPDEVPDQEEQLAKNEMIALVQEAIAELPERQQILLSLVYLEDLSQVQAAEVLGVTESRVSQILAQTRKQLRKAVQRVAR